MSPAVIYRWKVVMIFILTLTYHELFTQELKKYWVYFNDKGIPLPVNGILLKTSQAYNSAASVLSPRAIQRRAKVLPQESLVDAQDLPVYQPYVNNVVGKGATLVQQSRWMNAASFIMSVDQTAIVASLPYVEKVTKVIILRGKEDRKQSPRPAHVLTLPSPDYGESLDQIEIIDVIPLHEMGITGEGVLVGMLDSGFRWKQHEALSTRNVIAEYDFIFQDSTTANQTHDASNQDFHGTLTMSVLGGYKPGKLIGPAYGAEFALAKTEYIPSETSIEEDFWAAGIEWLEAKGADVVSSSLGYDVFSDTDGYTWEHGDFNGRTSVTANAAVRAARLGLLVCSAMGNEGNGNGVVGTMLTPGDADSILSVGAMNFNKSLAYYSSTGPTNDGRIKPDVVAPGTSVYGASTSGKRAYTRQQGTSLSTPLVAGTAALVISARPELTPQQVIGALKNTASTTNASGYTEFPNNFLGWGLIDAYRAALSFGPIFSNQPTVAATGGSTKISTTVVSKFGLKPDSVLLQYYDGNLLESPPVYTTVTMHLDQPGDFSTSGTYSVTLSGLPDGFHLVFHIEARDSGNHIYQTPAPVYQNDWETLTGSSILRMVESAPAAFALFQNYPNPFNSSTTINVQLQKGEWLNVTVYSLSGQKIKTITDSYSLQGIISLRWDGSDEHGNSSASGMYLVRVTTPSFSSSIKMVLAR